MSKEYVDVPLFRDVDYDAAFPVAGDVVTAEVPAVVEPTVEDAIATITAEIALIENGLSGCTPYAITIGTHASPFGATLARFTKFPTKANSLVLVDMAAQDYGQRFANFVAALVTPLFKGNK